jgi:hypothetical protein
LYHHFEAVQYSEKYPFGATFQQKDCRPDAKHRLHPVSSFIAESCVFEIDYQLFTKSFGIFSEPIPVNPVIDFLTEVIDDTSFQYVNQMHHNNGHVNMTSCETVQTFDE